MLSFRCFRGAESSRNPIFTLQCTGRTILLMHFSLNTIPSIASLLLAFSSLFYHSVLPQARNLNTRGYNLHVINNLLPRNICRKFEFHRSTSQAHFISDANQLVILVTQSSLQLGDAIALQNCRLSLGDEFCANIRPRRSCLMLQPSRHEPLYKTTKRYHSDLHQSK